VEDVADNVAVLAHETNSTVLRMLGACPQLWVATNWTYLTTGYSTNVNTLCLAVWGFQIPVNSTLIGFHLGINTGTGVHVGIPSNVMACDLVRIPVTGSHVVIATKEALHDTLAHYEAATSIEVTGLIEASSPVVRSYALLCYTEYGTNALAGNIVHAVPSIAIIGSGLDGWTP
jgi:hypothetical protein